MASSTIGLDNFVLIEDQVVRNTFQVVTNVLISQSISEKKKENVKKKVAYQDTSLIQKTFGCSKCPIKGCKKCAIVGTDSKTKATKWTCEKCGYNQYLTTSTDKSGIELKTCTRVCPNYTFARVYYLKAG